MFSSDPNFDVSDPNFDVSDRKNGKIVWNEKKVVFLQRHSEDRGNA